MASPTTAKQLVLTPSRLHTFAFCPRIPFYDHYLKLKKPLRQRLRMLLGRLLHWLHHLLRPGYAKEELLRAPVPELNILLVGKPDAYKIDGGVILLEEFKSTRMPRAPNKWGIMAWESDMVQALAYAHILRHNYGLPVHVTIRYIDGVTTFDYNQQMHEILLSYLEEYRKMVDYKMLPDTVRNRRCHKCQYKQLCDQVDETPG